MNDDEIRGRLRALGQEPIDEQTRAAHMRRMAAGIVVDEPRRRGFVWAGIAAAAVVGFLAGSTGLAMADALPDPAQEVAHDVLRVVQVDVPQGKRGPCVAEAAKIKDKDAKKAAKDACPKGGGDEDGEESGDGSGTPRQGPPPADDPCRGRPPWAGPMSKEQREAAKESASRANCPTDDEDSSGEGGGQAGPPAQDDPCRGRPPWAGPMSKEQREAAKESASRENCPTDDEDADDDADADASADAAGAATPTESTTTTSTTSTSTTSTTSTTAPAESTAIDEPSSGD